MIVGYSLGGSQLANYLGRNPGKVPAAVMRGPMVGKVVGQMLSGTEWGDLDYLLVDLPPGTGDISISLAGFLPTAEMYVVTTPQPAAQTVAQRAAFMADKVNLKVHGVIENMSWFTGDDGTRYELFGSGGGQALADRIGVPLLGQVPLVPALRDGGCCWVEAIVGWVLLVPLAASLLCRTSSLRQLHLKNRS